MGFGFDSPLWGLCAFGVNAVALGGALFAAYRIGQQRTPARAPQEDPS